MTFEDIQYKIDQETALCVEQKRNQPFFQFAWMRSRRSFEPGCRTEVTRKYQSDLNAAQQQQADREQLAWDVFEDEAFDDNDQAVKVGFFAILALIIIAIVVY